MRLVGPHRVTNLNITDPAIDRLFDDSRKAWVFYIDPPWGEGLMKYWATKASKDTGRKFDPITYDAFLSRVTDLIVRHVEEHVFFETGFRWQEDAINRLAAIGIRSISTVRLVYGGTLENVLIHGSFSGRTSPIGRLAGMSGAKVSENAIKPHAIPGSIVFDPCCGLGYSARAAIANGMEFRGNELNPVRLEKTIVRLGKAVISK